MVNRPKRIAARWRDVFLYGVVAAAICFLIEPVATEFFATIVGGIPHHRPGPFLFAIAIVTMAVVWWMGHGRWSGMIGVKHLTTYPPLWVAVAIGAVMVLLMQENWLISSALFSALTVTFIVRGVWFWVSRTPSADQSTQAFHPIESSMSPRAELAEFSRLMRWLADADKPITKPESDAFGHTSVAHRMARRLCDDPAEEFPTIAVVGPVGSGKTSIVELVHYYLAQERQLGSNVVSVKLSLWPFDTPDAAVRGVLNALTTELRKHVNILGIVGIADSYVQAIERAGGLLAGIARFLVGNHQPNDILDKLEDIAIAINLRIVVWIEDMERFAGADRLDPDSAQLRDADRVGAVRALLYELDRRARISVIICDGSIESRIDVGKIARFIERPPKVKPADAWKLINAFRDGCLRTRHESLIDPASPEIRRDLDVTEAELQLGLLDYRRDPARPGIKEAVSLLLATPRTLKSALRIAYDTWERLAGEIDFDDVLIMSAMREARPRIFALVDDAIGGFRKGFGKSSDRMPGPTANEHPVMQRLEKLLKDEDDVVIANSIRAVLDRVFPDHSGDVKIGPDRLGYVDKPQGLCVYRHVDYWSRYTSAPAIPDEESDQSALLAIAAWKESEPNDIVDRLLDHSRGAQMETFVGSFSTQDLCKLLRQVADRMLPESAESWYQRSRAPGVDSVWRMMQAKRPRSSDLVPLLTDLVCKAIPLNLPLAHELDDNFGEQELKRMTPLISEDESNAIRQDYLATILSSFPRGSGEKLIAAINEGSPYLLYWLCWARKARRLDRRDTDPFERWDEFSAVMVEAADINPKIMLPQIIPFITTPEERILRPPSNDAAASVAEYVSDFDEASARRLFADYDRLMELFAETEIPDWLPSQAADAFEVVRSVAIQQRGVNGNTET